jgi:hypothetical protein
LKASRSILVCSFSIGESLPDGRDGRLGMPAAAGGTKPDWRSRTRPENAFDRFQ